MNKDLEEDLFSIGIQLVVPTNKLRWLNIEQTIIDTILLVPSDRKLFSLVLSWCDTYADRLIADKLIKLYKKLSPSKEQKIWFNALFIFLVENGDRRFKALPFRYSKKKLAREDYQSALDLKGSNSIFEKYNLLIPNSFVMISQKNIATKEMLIKRSLVMKNRYLFGANWRSDIISAIEHGMSNPFQIKNQIGCSYDSAYRVFKDYQIANLNT